MAGWEFFMCVAFFYITTVETLLPLSRPLLPLLPYTVCFDHVYIFSPGLLTVISMISAKSQENIIEIMILNAFHPDSSDVSKPTGLKSLNLNTTKLEA